MKIKRILVACIVCAALVFGFAACTVDESYTYTLNYANLYMRVGQEQQLSVTVDPQKEFTVSYESSNEDVATVSESGLVTAVAGGKAVITVTTSDVTLSCNVEVTTEQYVWSLNYGAAILGVGAQLTLQPSVLPQKEFTAAYSSSDEEVATVSESGTVTGVKAGKAVITADVGNLQLTCEVSVSDSATNYAYTLSESMSFSKYFLPTPITTSENICMKRRKRSWCFPCCPIRMQALRSPLPTPPLQRWIRTAR